MPRGPQQVVFDVAGAISVNKSLRAHLQGDISSCQVVGVTFVDQDLPERQKKTSTALDKDGNYVKDPNARKTNADGSAAAKPWAVWETMRLLATGQGSRFSSDADLRGKARGALEAYITWRLPNTQTSYHYGPHATLQMWQKACAGK